MRILVYPHSMEVGGSQLNAVEIAAAVRDRGHDVLVYSEAGPLVDRVADLGLEHRLHRPSRIRPGIATAHDLQSIVRARRIDVVHGYEWPPILEGYAATLASRTCTAVGTIMSMSIAPFLPSAMPLIVGTADLRDSTSSGRTGPVELLEPPVDTVANAPGICPDPPAEVTGLDPAAVRVVIVSRLVPQLKLEGILTAIRAVGALAARRPVQLIVVGAGPSIDEVRAAASAVNGAAGRQIVLVTGESADPRWAYGSADISIGMGGSALRAAAFGTALVVQGEGGFFEALCERTVDVFLKQGWYGTAQLNQDEAVDRLLMLLTPLVEDVGLRRHAGEFGRRLVVGRFSLSAAAAWQEGMYEDAILQRARAGRKIADAAHAGAGLVRYKVVRRIQRVRGRHAVDDFNARPALSGAAGSA